MAVQHSFYPRTLKGDRQLDVTEHAAEQSEDGSKERQKGNEEMRGLTQNNLILLSVSITLT
jgi:hypothetical protein